jgi:hypothetical protein
VENLVYNINYFIFTLNLQKYGRKKHYGTGKSGHHPGDDQQVKKTTYGQK